MGLFSKGLVGVILAWSIYSGYRLYQSSQIPSGQVGEPLLQNLVKKDEDFDVHVYLSTSQQFNLRTSQPFRDPAVRGRWIPSFAHDHPCDIDTLGDPFLLASFRTKYHRFHGEGGGALARVGPWLGIGIGQREQITEAVICNPDSDSVTPVDRASYFDFVEPDGGDVIRVPFPKSLLAEHTVYLSAVATNVVKQNEPQRALLPPITTRLTAEMTPDDFLRPRRLLLQDPWQEAQRLAIENALHSSNVDGAASLEDLRKVRVTSVPAEVTIAAVVEHGGLPRSGLSQIGLGGLIFRDPASHNLTYVPPLTVNSFGSPRDEFSPIADSSLLETAAKGSAKASRGLSEDIFFRLRYRTIGYRSLLLQSLMSQSLDKLEEQFEAGSYDIDSLKMLIGNQPHLLASVMAVSLLHTVFACLAISADVTYWTTQSREATLGVSALSILMEIAMGLFVSLYLIDVGTSKFVLSFSLARLVVYCWKLWKLQSFGTRDKGRCATNPPAVPLPQEGAGGGGAGNAEKLSVADTKSAGLPPDKKADDAFSANAVEIQEFEYKWTMRLLGVILPLVIGVGIYQLVYVPQYGWWSWMVHTLALCSYAAGFVAMTPQLFRNYKLQSVDHLPWATLTYQAINAFIDDLFALVIRMPQMHKMSAFRDDIVFIVFAIQRVIYQRRRHAKLD